MKNYVSFKLIGAIRDIMDCYMVGLWTDSQLKKELAIELFSLYLKNWSTGLDLVEWKRAKVLIEFWKVEINKSVE